MRIKSSTLYSYVTFFRGKSVIYSVPASDTSIWGNFLAEITRLGRGAKLTKGFLCHKCNLEWGLTVIIIATVYHQLAQHLLTSLYVNFKAAGDKKLHLSLLYRNMHKFSCNKHIFRCDHSQLTVNVH